jgi:tetratricopeptide (TPR) repeat protein
MARKRLNKKVAIIGSAVFVSLILSSIALVLYMSRDPEGYVKDGDAALKAAREATDDQLKTEEYKRAERNYQRANGLAKNDNFKVEMLFKLSEIYLETEQWRSALGCWNGIVNIKPDNFKARQGRLEYVYIVADSGAGPAVWQEVVSQASDFIQIVEAAGKFEEELSQWSSLEDKYLETGNTLGSNLFFVRGRAKLILARLGATTEPDLLLNEAVDDLKKALEYEQDNVHVYRYLALAAFAHGEILASRGNLGARTEALEEALSYLQQAIDLSPESIQANINLIRFKLNQARSRGEITSLKPDILSLDEKFGNNPKVNYQLSRVYETVPKELDSAIEACDKALELDAHNVIYALKASGLHYRKFSYYNDESQLYRAIEIAKVALESPEAQETTGPRNIVNRRNQLSLHFFLANCYIEWLLQPGETMSESERQEWLRNAEDSVHQIEQIFGSGEDPYVILWQGMLELAKGENSSAVRKLSDAYEQLKISGIQMSSGSYLKNTYAMLSYTLANYYKESSEQGAVYRYLNSALLTGIRDTKPQVLLDFVEQAIKLGQLRYVFSNLDFYDSNFGATPASKRLRIMAYINGNQFEEAEKVLEESDLEEVKKTELQVLLLQARIRQLQLTLNRKKTQEYAGVLTGGSEDFGQDPGLLVSSDTQTDKISDKEDDIITRELKNYREQFSRSIEKYIQLSTESLDEALLSFSYRNYISLNRIQPAQAFVDKILSREPDNLMALFYREYLLEPEPVNISLERRSEIQMRVLLNTADSVEQWLNLGNFYLQNNQFDESAEQFNKVLMVEAWEQDNSLFTRPSFEGIERTDTQLQISANQLFGLAIELKDLELAKKIANIARIGNLDECEGQYFYARLAVEQKQYEDALNYINSSINLRPAFSHAYMLRSAINGELGDENASIEDAREAIGLNPQNPNHVKRLALVLCQRNMSIGDDNVTDEQRVEARGILDRALALNSTDRQLLSFYAEYISSTEPYRALAIRQYLYKNVLNVKNALLLGNMAMKIALSEQDETRKNAFLDISGQALADAYKLNPRDRTTIDTYARYYRIIGEEGKAWELLEKSENKELLWNNLYRQGQYAEAKVVLQQMYANDLTDANSLLGLLLVSKEMNDVEGVKEYSEKLVLLERSADDYLIQIQTFLEVGLVRESELKLQSFMERFPEKTEAILLQAWLMMRQGRLKDSLEAANRYLEKNEESQIAWEVRGKIHYLLADYNQAISDFNRSRSFLDSPQLSIYLSKAYMRAQRNQEAIIELQSALENPQLSNQARLLLEEIYIRLNRKDELRRFYDNVVRVFPDDVLWHIKVASFAQQEGDFSRASSLYNRALQLALKEGRLSLVALDGYLNALISDSKYADLFEVAPNYVNGEYASVALFRMAEAKLKIGDRVSAIEYCQQALDKSRPDSIRATGIVNKMYSLFGKEVLYEYCLERLAINPDSENINFIMFFLTLADNEQYNKAIEYIDNCIRIAGLENPQSLIYTLEKARVLNLAYEKTSDKIYLSKAITEHKSLLLKMPNNIGVLNNLAFLLAESDENLIEALEYARRAYEARPNNPNILDTYAFVLYKNRKYEQAAELSQAALQYFEDDQSAMPAVVYEHLGMIREKLGLTKEAIDAYQQALSVGGLSKKSVDRINSAINQISQGSL